MPASLSPYVIPPQPQKKSIALIVLIVLILFLIISEIIINNPTQQFYELLQHAYEFFNKSLFIKERLPNCLITVQRGKNTMGYFFPNRWGNDFGKKTHEIALNPTYFAEHKVIEIFQTLVHEMCHVWQYEYTQLQKASLRTYHNKEWSNKMISIGLMPTDKDGKRTGQKTWDTPVSGGLFEESCKELIKSGFAIKWIDRFPASKKCDSHLLECGEQKMHSKELSYLYSKPPAVVLDSSHIKEIKIVAKAKKKYKYSCKSCGNILWGKRGIKASCIDCNAIFLES
jgi:predicted SprT family Zn-dependent metalloprotease